MNIKLCPENLTSSLTRWGKEYPVIKYQYLFNQSLYNEWVCIFTTDKESYSPDYPITQFCADSVDNLTITGDDLKAVIEYYTDDTTQGSVTTVTMDIIEYSCFFDEVENCRLHEFVTTDRHGSGVTDAEIKSITIIDPAYNIEG